MSDFSTIERQLKFLLNLSSGVRYTSNEFTERFGISHRTFFRDKEVLENLGFLIERQNGRYWIDKHDSRIKKLQDLPYCSEEEAYILQRAIHSIDENNQLKMNNLLAG